MEIRKYQGRDIKDDLIGWNQSLSISASGETKSTQFTMDDYDLLVHTLVITARSTSKMILETDSARDPITIQITNNDNVAIGKSPMDMFALNRLYQSIRFPTFTLQGKGRITLAATHTPLSAGVVLTFPIVVDFFFLGTRVV